VSEPPDAEGVLDLTDVVSYFEGQDGSAREQLWELLLSIYGTAALRVEHDGVTRSRGKRALLEDVIRPWPIPGLKQLLDTDLLGGSIMAVPRRYLLSQAVVVGAVTIEQLIRFLKAQEIGTIFDPSGLLIELLLDYFVSRPESVDDLDSTLGLYMLGDFYGQLVRPFDGVVERLSTRDLRSLRARAARAALQLRYGPLAVDDVSEAVGTAWSAFEVEGDALLLDFLVDSARNGPGGAGAVQFVLHMQAEAQERGLHALSQTSRSVLRDLLARSRTPLGSATVWDQLGLSDDVLNAVMSV
jgi:hypothetical protein